MNFLKRVKEVFQPTSVSCDQGNTELEMSFDPMSMDEDFQYQGAKPSKVPPFEHFFNPILMITANPEFIKGFRFDMTLPLSQFFNISHSWQIPNSGTQEEPNPMNPMMMPTQSKPTYTFNTQLVRDIKGQDPGVVMVGKVDNDGKVDGVFVKKLTDNISMKVTGNFQSSNIDQGVLSVDLDFEDKNSNQQIKFGQGHFGFNIMQKIHPRLILGVDYMNLYTQKLSFFSYAAKAMIKSHSFSLQYIGIQSQLNLGYVIPIKKGTQFVAHYKMEQRQKKTTTTLGFKQRYDRNDIIATINSKGQVSTTVSLRTQTLSLRLCALVDYIKQKYSFGYGVTFGQMM